MVHSSFRVHLFGSLRLVQDGEALSLPASVIARSLLAYLLFHHQQPLPRSLLGGIFWPDVSEARARRFLSQALWQIRRSLQPNYQYDTSDYSSVLLTAGDTVQFNPELPVWVDADQFLEHYAQCSDEASGGLVHCQACDKLYTGEFLTGYYEDWVLAERARFQDMFVTGLDRLLKGSKLRGDYEGALGYARRLTQEACWREDAHQEVMRLCSLLGRNVEALKQYDICCQVLAQELAIEPSLETVALAAEITDRSKVTSPLILPSAAQPVAVPLLDERDQLSLVGRQAELAELLRHVEGVARGSGNMILVCGEAGVGKTRLMQAVARDAEWRGAQVLFGGARELGFASPFASLVEALQSALSPLRIEQLTHTVDKVWLQVLAPLIPELKPRLLDLPSAPPLEPAQEKERLTEAFIRFLGEWGRIMPLVLILEDLHWADGDTLDLLASLIRRIGEIRLLLIGTYRDDEARSDPVVWKKLQALDRAGPKDRLVLNRLDAESSAKLIRYSLGLQQATPVFESRLYQETDGNPLFVLETLRTLYDEGVLKRDSAGNWSTPWDETTADYAELPLPPVVEQVISRRLVCLNPETRKILEIAAVLGNNFNFSLLDTSSPLDISILLGGAGELVRLHFWDEEPETYRFSHDKIRQVAYQSIEPKERQQLHQQAGDAVESLNPDRVETLAFHFTQAQVWNKAAFYHQQSGDRARAVYANSEAISYYTQALKALEQVSPFDLQCSFELHLAREAVYGLLGERAAQADDLTALDILAVQIDADELETAKRQAEVALRKTQYAESKGDYLSAVSIAQEAVRLAQVAQDVEREAKGYIRWSGVLWRLGEYHVARQWADKALRISHTAGLHALEASSLRLLGAISRYQNDPIAAKKYHIKALNMYCQIGDKQGEGVTFNNLGVHFAWRSDLSAARDYYEQALKIFSKIGDCRNEGLQYNNLGILFDQLGDYSRSSTYLQKALEISYQINDRRGESQALNSLSNVLIKFGEYERAKGYLQQALQITRELGDRFEESITLLRSGELNLCLGSYKTAREILRQALEINRELGFRQGERWCLNSFSWAFYHLGEYKNVLKHSQEMAQIAQELNDPPGQAYSVFIAGRALFDLGRLTDAVLAYEQAFNLFQDLNQQALAIKSLAELANIYLTQGNLDQARVYIEDVLTFIYSNDHGGTKLWEPFRVYLICFRVLFNTQDLSAREILEAAYDLLQERANKIADQAMRRSYLENVATHREIIAAYQELRSLPEGQQILVCLPRVDAPLGRPLREDELVAVNWVVNSPKDEEIQNKVIRRRHRLMRLLGQAQNQGAAPSYHHLAEALNVGVRTIERDMSALQQTQPNLPPTRGKK